MEAVEIATHSNAESAGYAGNQPNNIFPFLYDSADEWNPIGGCYTHTNLRTSGYQFSKMFSVVEIQEVWTISASG